MKRIIFLLFLCLTAPLLAQSTGGSWKPEESESSGAEEASPGAITNEGIDPKGIIPPEGYRKITLGMDLEQVKEQLKDDVYFDYKGPPDVSFRPGTDEPIIQTEGNSFIDKAFFQFYEKKLYIIILILDPEKIDHYSLYSSLKESYGEPLSLSPQEIIWEFDTVRLALERPLSVKYIDLEQFNKLKKSGIAEEDYLDTSRKEFLKQF